jgi:signal transduction histidine kinase
VHSSPPDFSSSTNHLVLTYVADLELEVDRLRKQGQFMRHAVADEVSTIRESLANDSASHPSAPDVSQAADRLAAVLHDLHDPPGYHPAHDQVIAIPLRPVIEQVFRWQQRLLAASHAVLHIELGVETINWFPARFRHILDNLMSNALKYRDPDKGESRVTVEVQQAADSIELRVMDNGLGVPWAKRAEAFDFFYRSAPLRSAGLGVGLAVIKMLIEKSGGSLTVESGVGKGSNFTAILPRYDVGDFLT